MNLHEYRVMRSVEETHWWYRGLRSVLLRELLKIQPAADSSILDVGCGTGANTRMIRQRFPDSWVVCLDRAEEALNEVQPPICQADANFLPIGDAEIDIVVAMDLLGQDGVNFEQTLSHFLRVLKPGGVLLINVPVFSWLAGEHDAAVHVTRRFEPLEIRKGLTAAGFECVTLQFWNALLLLPMWLRRRMSRATPAGRARSDLQLNPAPINALLSAWIVRETAWKTAPLGSSIFSTARKPILR